MVENRVSKTEEAHIKSLGVLEKACTDPVFAGDGDSGIGETGLRLSEGVDDLPDRNRAV